MSRLSRVALLGLLATVAGTDMASAQYYPPPPPPAPYYPPGYYPRPRPGFQCEANAFTPYGRREIICSLSRPRPLGEGCRCPPPPPPPGYAPSPWLRGRVIP